MFHKLSCHQPGANQVVYFWIHFWTRMMVACPKNINIIFLVHNKVTYLWKKTLIFCKVDDINPYRSLKFISHTEHEPLSLPLTICVIPYPYIVWILIALSHLFNIGTLKVSVEKNFLLTCEFVGNCETRILGIGRYLTDTNRNFCRRG